MDKQAKDSERIMQLERESCRKLLEGDFQWSLDHILAENILQLSPGMDLQDRAGYAAWVQEFVKMEGVVFSWEPTKVIVSEAGDFGYCYGTTKLEVTGQPDRLGKYVSIWQKIGGEWKCVVEANNYNDA